MRLAWFSIVVIAGILAYSTAKNGNLESVVSLSPTPVVFPAPRFGEPELICPYFRNVQPGYDWNGVTIGIGNQSDLEDRLSQFGPYELVLPVEGTLANSIGYRWRESRAEGLAQQAPAQVDVCFQDSRIMVLDMTWYYQPPAYLSDFLIEFGTPDTVTWSTTETTRVVFWFEQGIAAEVIVSLEDPSSYGVITRVIYFPPQTSEGYEMKWPYTVTRTEPFMPVDPAVPAERNPFDFETMIATTTASPRTTTPTPIPSDSRPVDTYFPRSLVCSDAVAGNGPSIGLVTIGETRLDEMEAIYMEYFDIGLEYSEATGETSIFLREFDSDFAYRNRVINICVVDGVIVAASNTFPTSTQLEQLGDEEISATPDPTTFQYTTIDMLVSQYGAPDVVTYSSQPFGRVAFWFEQGIAAVVYVRFDPPGSAYLSGFGTVSAIVYFPFQDVAGYEDRWPFNQTYPQERFATDDAPFVATDLPIERNPFDFDAMISTMTAEPSPTLAP